MAVRGADRFDDPWSRLLATPSITPHAVAGLRTLEELRAALLRAIPDEARWNLVNSRLILRTGVNLREPRPGQNADAAVVAKVRTALADMGFGFDARAGERDPR